MKQVIRNLTQLMPWVAGCEFYVQFWRTCQDLCVLWFCHWLIVTQSWPRLSRGLISSLGRTPYLIDFHITYSLLRPSKADKVLQIVNLGNLSSYWPRNISSFTKKLFLKKGCQQPFFSRLRKMPTFVLCPKQATALSLSLSAVNQNRSTPASSQPKTSSL